MNIGFVVHRYDPQEGTGGYAVEILQRLAARHAVTLYASHLAVSPPDGVRVVPVPALRASAYTTILSFPLGFRSVRRRHDLLHSQGWSAPRAEVITAHVVVAAWRAAARRSRVRSNAGERFLGGLVARQERLACTAARAVIAPSRRAQQDLAAHYACSANVHVIPHGCDRRLTLPGRREVRGRLGLPPARFLALYLGDVRKGLTVALRALSDAPDADLLVLSHADAGPARALATDLGVGARVHWLPRGASAADALGAADALLHPTIYDTFALPVGEALWSGLPVIVSAAAGASELVEHDRSAWILPEPSPDLAARALRALAADAGLRERLARGGRTVAERYTWDEAAKRTMDLYEQVAR